MVEPAKDYPTYHLDPVDVSDNPLRALGVAIEKNGKDWPRTTAADSRLPIQTLWSLGREGWIHENSLLGL